jgi:putative Holliday junction resolvase
MRILGLDVGSKTIGVAVSDPTGIIAQGVKTIDRGNRDWREQLEKIAQEYEIKRIVIGLPIHMNGSEGKEVASVRKFGDFVGEKITVPIIYWDERLSTVAAERTLLEADLSREKRKKVIDKMAAVFILQGYLDAQTF